MRLKVVAALSAVALLAGAGFAMSADPASAGGSHDRGKTSYGDWSKDYDKDRHHWSKDRDGKDRYKDGKNRGDKDHGKHDRDKDRDRDRGKHDKDRGKHHGGQIVEKTFTKLVPASHPQQAWQAEVTTTIKKLVPKYGETKVISVTTELTGCLNHQGNRVGGYANNPNCQPAGY